MFEVLFELFRDRLQIEEAASVVGDLLVAQEVEVLGDCEHR